MFKIKNLFLLLIFFFLFLYKPFVIRSEDNTIIEKQKLVEELQGKINELHKAKDTLANQIFLLNSQVELTLLKINQTESSINLLENEISNLTVKISGLDVQLDQLTSILIQQISQNYKLQKRMPLFGFIITSDLNNYMTQHKYVTAVQKNSQENLLSLETVRTNYDLQKAEKTKKQQELEELQKKLADQKISLAKQKESKTNLLEITKNDEVRYQKLKQAAEDELNSLLTAKFVGKKEVKRGEAIGLMGNTGYSFGSHLHFGLYNLKENNLSDWTYENDIDAASYLSSHSWPMSEPRDITQGRGNTKYSYLYADRFHHGLDIVSSNKIIYATDDGIAYFYEDKYPNQKKGSGKHVKLFHPDGKMTLYLHMQ